jgi:hypothetical protein
MEECDSYIPAGEWTIKKFHGEAAFNPNCAVKLVWDYQGAGEEILWSIKGSGVMPVPVTRTGDGVKKVAVCLDNGLVEGPVIMSGHAEIEEEV